MLDLLPSSSAIGIIPGVLRSVLRAITRRPSERSIQVFPNSHSEVVEERVSRVSSSDWTSGDHRRNVHVEMKGLAILGSLSRLMNLRPWAASARLIRYSLSCGTMAARMVPSGDNTGRRKAL